MIHIHFTQLRAATLFSKAVWLCAGLMLAACGPGAATPMPEPPSFLKGERVRPSAAEVKSLSNVADADFLGAPGSAPAGAIVYLTNLDSQNRVVASNVQADGSFTIGATMQSGDELRFIVVNGGARSVPFDARYESTPAAATLTPSLRLECLSLNPGPILDFKASSMAAALELTISNSCGMPVVVENARFRLNLPDYLVENNALPTLASGASAAVRIKFSPKQAGVREDVLFFDAVMGATRVRYAVSLFGQ